MPDETPSISGSANPLGRVVAALAIVVVAVAAFAFHEHSVSKRLADQNSAVTSALNATHDQLNALSSRLDAINAEREAEKPAAPVYHKPMNAAVARHRIEDPRCKKMQGQLDERPSRLTPLARILPTLASSFRARSRPRTMSLSCSKGRANVVTSSSTSTRAANLPVRVRLASACAKPVPSTNMPTGNCWWTTSKSRRSTSTFMSRLSCTLPTPSCQSSS